jgi:hypothetical protein
MVKKCVSRGEALDVAGPQKLLSRAGTYGMLWQTRGTCCGLKMGVSRESTWSIQIIMRLKTSEGRTSEADYRKAREERWSYVLGRDALLDFQRDHPRRRRVQCWTQQGYCLVRSRPAVII